MLADDEFRGAAPHFPWRKQFVRLAVQQHPAEVNPRLMQESRFSCYRAVGCIRPDRGPGYEGAEISESGSVDPAFCSHRMSQGHHHLLQGGVPCPLPESIDSHTYGVRAPLNGGNAIRRGHPQVVVTVEAVLHP